MFQIHHVINLTIITIIMISSKLVHEHTKNHRAFVCLKCIQLLFEWNSQSLFSCVRGATSQTKVKLGLLMQCTQHTHAQ